MQNRQWLQQEFETWRREGLVDEGTLARLSVYYARQPKSPSLPLIIFGSLGALLIGLGIIALLAANWDALSRPVRTLIAFTPLTLCVAAYLYRAATARTWGRGFFEPLGIFWGLSIGVAISIVAQTYHISGDEEAFALIWTLLLLPVVAATRALAPTVGYFIGLLIWTSMAQSNGGVGLYYWPLATLAGPVLMAERRANPTSVRVSLMEWGAIACSVAALGVSLEKCVPGLWMLIYSSAFSLLLLYSVCKENRHVSRWLQPGLLWGGGGLAVLLFLLISQWPWAHIGFSCYREMPRFHAWAAWFDYALAFGLPLAVLAVLLRTRRQFTNCLPLAWAMAPFAVATAFAVGGLPNVEPTWPALIITGYYLALGLLTLFQGLAENSLGKINLGTLMVLAVALQKFFTSDWSFTAKGIAFILAGLAFFLMNLFLSRRIRTRGARHA